MRKPVAMFWLFVSLLVSCSKKIDLTPVFNKGIAAVIDSSVNTSIVVENLGSPFKTTNVSWQINPLNPNKEALIVNHPNSTTGYELVMIDNGLSNSNTPINSFNFISINLNENTAKTIKILNVVTGQQTTNSVGRIVRYVFGKNKKLYIATEGSYGGGGHIIEYDPNTQTAWDLGKPFYINGKYLDIYSLNVGTDGTLYGGSFGGSGEVMTFRYHYSEEFDVDKTTLNTQSRYVSYISGDENYTYASCGEDSWYLYAIEKATGKKTILLSNNNANYRIELNTYSDAPYAKLINTHYLLQNGTISSLAANNRPPTDIVANTIYSLTEANSLNINYSNANKKLTYNLNGVQKELTLNNVTEDIKKTGASIWLNNKLYSGSANSTFLGSYDDLNKWNVLGSTGVDLYSITASSANSNTLFMGAYPKGNLLQYNVNQPWTLNTQINNSSTQSTSQINNPGLIAALQNADKKGTSGPLYISALSITKNNLIVAVGDNDRITGSASRELAISSLQNGEYTNISLPEFAQYNFAGMCLTPDSNNAIISAVAVNGGSGKIYKFNPSSNKITGSFTFPSNNPGKIILFNASTIAGFYDDVLYLMDINSGKVIWKKILGGGQRIFSIAKSPDGSLCAVHMYLQATHFRAIKIQLTTNAQNNYSDADITIAEFDDANQYEESKPDNILFAPSYGYTNRFDLYITGLKSVYRIKYAAKL